MSRRMPTRFWQRILIRMAKPCCFVVGPTALRSSAANFRQDYLPDKQLGNAADPAADENVRLSLQTPPGKVRHRAPDGLAEGTSSPSTEGKHNKPNRHRVPIKKTHKPTPQ